MSYFKSSLLFFYYFISCVIYSQELDNNKQYEVACFGFYNLENLFDTIIDPDTNKILQDDFSPHSQKQWNTKKYYHKLNNIADVISQLGVTSFSPDGVSVLGVCEIENKNVLEDLVANKKIKNRNYQIVHHEGPDRPASRDRNPLGFAVRTPGREKPGREKQATGIEAALHAEQLQRSRESSYPASHPEMDCAEQAVA